MQEESTGRMLVIYVAHLSVYCTMPLAGVRECNVEERIMNIVRSVCQGHSGAYCVVSSYERCRWGLHVLYLMLVSISSSPPVRNHFVFFPPSSDRIRHGSEKTCCGSICVYRNLPYTFYGITLYCIFHELYHLFI
jgi:hypothetical protein